jgi:hypothetical protein
MIPDAIRQEAMNVVIGELRHPGAEAIEAVVRFWIHLQFCGIACRTPPRRHEQRVVEKRVELAHAEQAGGHARQIAIKRRHSGISTLFEAAPRQCEAVEPLQIGFG